MDLKQNMNTLDQEAQRLQEQIEVLKRHKSRIPPDQLGIRDMLSAALDVSHTLLPFAGELLKVRQEEQEWEGAIERLLNGYARQMLVPDSLYQQVSRYVNDHNLRGRLVYLRISKQPGNAQIDHESGQVYTKLEIKPESDHYQWLQADIARRFDHVCCNTLADFYREPRAITREGQIKTGGDRHEKDDRRDLTDRRFYVLGWDNQDQIEAYRADLEQKQKEHDQLRKEHSNIEKERSTWASRDNVVRVLDGMTDFNRMHWRAEQELIERYQAEKSDLEARADASRPLRQRLEQIRAEISEVESEERRADTEVTRRSTQIESYDRLIAQLENRLRQAPPDSEEHRERIDAELKGRSITLENSDELSEQIRDTFVRRQKNFEGQRSTLSESLINRMADFRRDHPQLTEELDANLAALPGYRQLLEQIEREDLPRHQHRFKELLNEKILTNITIFDSSLKRREEEISQSVEHLNKALRPIPYTSATYIQLGHEATEDREVREFRAMLRACYANVDPRDAGSVEDSFHRVHELISRFQTDDRWSRKVTDVRNWMSFSASERFREDDKEKMFYTDSSGKSGGQKAKLAYTILASAIAYQYGLGQEEDRTRSFRFVVIDEAFSKSDESNSRYAMELFKQLGLQG